MQLPTMSFCMADPPLYAAYCTIEVGCLSSLVDLTPNAGPQPRLAAAARHERRLAGVGCRPMLGPAPTPEGLEQRCLTPSFPYL